MTSDKDNTMDEHLMESQIVSNKSDAKEPRPTHGRGLSQLRMQSWVSEMRGTSKVERIAAKMQHRMKHRIGVPRDINGYFLQTCTKIAKHTGYKTRMTREEFEKLHDYYIGRVEESHAGQTTERPVYEYIKKEVCGIWDKDETMLELLDRAKARMDAVNAEYFWFRDFNFFQMRIVKRCVWMRDPRWRALTSLLTFYTLSALIFCRVLEDAEVCPQDPTAQNRPYYGWISSLYFASVTMSTVGYGDLSLLGDEGTWRELIGALYMLIAVVVGVTLFSSVAEVVVSSLASSGLDRVARITEFPMLRRLVGDIPHHVQIRLIVWLRIIELVALFLLYNAVGTAIAYIFVRDPDEEGIEPWSLKTTFYWSIQTTTTIGYGDLSMPFNLRLFQVIYTTLGAVLVGGVIGGFSSLKHDVDILKRKMLWNQLEVSKRLIQDMKSSLDPDEVRINEYEFLVGSLLVLQKTNKDDIEAIMGKFRELSKGNDYIVYSANNVEPSGRSDTHTSNGSVDSVTATSPMSPLSTIDETVANPTTGKESLDALGGAWNG